MKRQPILVQSSTPCPYELSFGYVYMLVNTTNGHRYVGKHVHRRKRPPYEDNSYWGSGGIHLKNALAKLNGDKSKFKKYILHWVEWINDEEFLAIYLAALEIKYIDLLGTWKNPQDYNETPGGDSWECGELNPMWDDHRFAGENHPFYGLRGKDSPHYGARHSEETKRHLSILEYP